MYERQKTIVYDIEKHHKTQVSERTLKKNVLAYMFIIAIKTKKKTVKAICERNRR
jgi:tryptophan synthase alpha subunit